jgi:hypothetical protein
MEDNNASWRLGSRQDDETRDERMCAMQDETGSDEPMAPENEREDQDSSLHSLIWFIRLAAIGYLALTFYYLLNEPEVRLHTLYSMLRISRAIARTAGAWALEIEQSYNEYVNTLH